MNRKWTHRSSLVVVLSSTGSYFAGGALIGSTLAPHVGIDF